MSTHVFVSYSHADAPLVGPVVQLLRANRSLVFQDVDSIRPGKRWRGEIEHALAGSGLVVLFWCDHASRSDEVAKEWRTALAQGKDLLPLLLDATPLPAELSEFQWIDFRGTVGAGHGAIERRPAAAPACAGPPLAAPRPVRWFALAGVAAVFVGATALSLLTLNAPHSPVSATRPGDVPGTPALPPGPAPAADGLLLGALLVLAGMVALLVFLILRRRSRPAPAAAASPGEVEQRIANEVEAEILRRTAAPDRTGT
jgi:hypothetical protein